MGRGRAEWTEQTHISAADYNRRMSPELRDKFDYYLNYVIIAALIIGLLLYMDRSARSVREREYGVRITAPTPAPVIEGVERFDL